MIYGASPAVEIQIHPPRKRQIRRCAMKGLSALVVCAALTAVIVFAGCTQKSGTGPVSAVTIDPVKLQIFKPLPESMPSEKNPVTDAKVNLGRMLYYEPRLSKSQQISCNSCHRLDKFGVDQQPTSDGHKGLKGDRNSPTVYNAAGHFVQFWDGRAADVEEQAKGPVMNPVEMAMPSEKQVIAVLKSIPDYVDAFREAFPGEKDPINFENMAKAIGAFERKLVTPSRWDKFLQGDAQALTNEEKAGFLVYMETGCQACHAGAYLGGTSYQILGMAKPWPDASDPGREKVTRNESDRMLFKVPGLRNITETGPYYHNGKTQTLEQAVSRMAEYQLGKTLSDGQVRSIVTWLKTLTGEIPAEYIRPPVLPKSTAKTPKPEVE
jgi:cytochrome c peroxidase